MADATAEHGQGSPLRLPQKQAYAEATDEWTRLIRAAYADGHPIADIARAAGVAASSVHYRLKQGDSPT
ncbi:hypothetical protein SAMN03159343_0245 [Klenkia marina]|uniref:Helix-turn-helix domain of resolvase n=1 Tax=Klenkia marina TaxID=1960309 RepID=A0A1G4X9W5_9ACTN|nr:hypothetical protein SAMN03159343_0245 [Klenkia marina]